MPRLATLFATLTLVAVCLLAGCSGGDSAAGTDTQGKKVIAFRTMQLRPTFDDYFLPLIAEYEASHPDVVIDWQDMPFQNYKTKLMTSFMAGKAPDVINLSSEDLLVYVDEGRLIPLDPLVSQDVFDAYVPSLLEESCRFEGQTYGLPWYASAFVTFANKAILEEAGLPTDAPPLYYEDIPAIAEAVREKTDAFGIFPLYTEEGILRTYLLEGGQPLFDEQGRAAFNTERGRRILTYWTDLYRNNLVPSEALTATHRRIVELYKTGNLAVMSTAPQFLGQVKTGAPEIYANTIVGPRMRWHDSDTQFVALHTLSVSSQSKHPKEAADFAAFVTNGPNQLKFSKLVTIIPSVTEALNDPYFSAPGDTVEGKARLYSAQQVREGHVFRPPPNLNKLSRPMEDAMEQVAQGQKTAEEALAEAEDAWNEILGK
ncbi:MAG: putative chitobiose transport system substrate-binding protein [Candidatus Sumerlaeota bacterium]|nr:putative chitobiose transport system substrate-binding protein [Candidatus Sumerlaeota bacterium]